MTPPPGVREVSAGYGELALVEEIMEVGPSYERQRRAAPAAISTASDLHPVVDQLVRELETDELSR